MEISAALAFPVRNSCEFGAVVLAALLADGAGAVAAAFADD